MALTNIFERSAILGVDIDTAYIKIISRDQRGLPVRWLVEAIPEDLMRNGSIISDKKLGLFIREKLNKAGIRGKKCAICLSSDQVVVRQFSFPAMVEEALEENIRYEMAEYLPLGVDNYVIDYRILDNEQSPFQKNQLRVMAVAAPRELVNSCINAFKKAGLKPILMDIPQNCQEIWYNQYVAIEDLALEQKNVCLIYVGKVSTRITFLHQGSYFIDKISKSSMEEEKKIDLDLLLQELTEMLNFYYTRYPDCQINNIILMADKVQIKMLAETIEKRLALAVHAVELPVDSKGQVCLPNAIGASTKTQNDRKNRINLIRTKKRDRVPVQTMLKLLLAASLSLGIVIAGFWYPVRRKQKLLDRLRALEAQKDKYVDVLNSYEEVKSEIEYITSKKLQLNKLASEQIRLSELLDVIDDCIPNDIRILEISTERNVIKLLGRARDDGAIAQLLTALDGTGRFDRVSINEIILEQITGLKLFKLQCDVELYFEEIDHDSNYMGGIIRYEAIP